MKNLIASNLLSTLLLLTFLHSTIALAHGEDKLGPNGGYIKMPGAFHTELVPGNVGNLIKVYLLDMQFEKPAVENSSVEINYQSKSKSSGPIKCKPENNYFVCSPAKDFSLKKKGQLQVLAQRAGQKGNSVSYEVPLKAPSSH